jgi:hypothetical protein
MNSLPNDVVELQRELRLCVTLILQQVGPLDGDTPHEIVERFCEMYRREYIYNHPSLIIGNGSPMPTLFPPTKHTLCGLPVTITRDAPIDRVVLHPDILDEIERRLISTGPVEITHAVK